MWRIAKHGSIITTALLVVSVFILSGCTTPDGNVANGKRWYRMHNCFACHGEHGYDGRGPDISGLDMGYRSFLHRLRNAQTAIMPVFSEKKINDQDAADILAYLKSIKKSK